MEFEELKNFDMDNQMEGTELKNIKKEDSDEEEEEEEEENEIFQQVPIQTNQNSSVHNAIKVNKAYGSGLLCQNYMYQTLLFNQPINSNKKVCNEIMRVKKTEEMMPEESTYENLRIVSKTNTTIAERFVYEISTITNYKEQVEVESNCEWLDCRLEIHQIINDENVTYDQLVSQLRISSINVANDLMIFYHTHSDFALQLTRMESYNLLILLKDPRLQIVVAHLIDGFSESLLSIVKDGKILKDNVESLNITIPNLTEIIMNNCAIIDKKRRSLKQRFHSSPKVVFYSFFASSYIIMNGSQINPILDKRLISLQRRYFCKVILDGPFLRNTSSNTKGEYYRLDFFFDYQFNYWVVVKSELLKWASGFVRSMFQCYIDKVCLSFVTNDFFCCDEIQNLMKRQHLLREVDSSFAKLIKWAKIHQVDRNVL